MCVRSIATSKAVMGGRSSTAHDVRGCLWLFAVVLVCTGAVAEAAGPCNTRAPLNYTSPSGAVVESAPRCTDRNLWDSVQCTVDPAWCWCATQGGDPIATTWERFTESTLTPEVFRTKCAGLTELEPPGRSASSNVVIGLSAGMFVVAVAITCYCVIKRSQQQAMYMEGVLVGGMDECSESILASSTQRTGDGLSVKDSQQTQLMNTSSSRPPPTPPIPRPVGACFSGTTEANLTPLPEAVHASTPTNFAHCDVECCQSQDCDGAAELNPLAFQR